MDTELKVVMAEVDEELVEGDVSLAEVLSDTDHYESALEDLKSMLFSESIDLKDRYLGVQLEGGEMIYMKIGMALINFVVLRPFVQFQNHGIPLDRDILITETVTSSVLSSYLTTVILSFYDIVDDPQDINLCVASVLKDLSDLAIAANNAIGNTVSLYDLFRLSDAVPEMWELLNLSIPDNLGGFKEIEDFIDAKQKRLVSILSTEDNSLKNMMVCQAAINTKQLSQMLMNVSLKPDLTGRVISEPIDTSFVRGLRNVQDYYINSISARKALVTNYKQVKTSGYLARKLALLTVNCQLDPDLDDCGSTHGITLHVDCRKTFDKVVGRWTVDGGQILDEHFEMLEGHEVVLRSPITCAGDMICKKCYGHLAELNKDLHVGILGTLILTAQLTQILLSSKHLLQTRSEKIDWPDEFYDCFVVDKDQIIPTGAVTNIVLSRSDVAEDEDVGEYYTRRFFYDDGEGNRRVLVESPVPLYFNDWLREKFLEEDDEKIDVTMGDGLVPFYYSMENVELSASLRMILDLIEKSEHLGLGDDIDAVYGKFISLLNDSAVRIQSVHIELILRELVRDASDVHSRPDFTKMEVPPYVILRLPEAIINSEYLSTSLSFQEIRRQFHNPDTYRKTREGMLDGLFVN